MTSRVEKLIRLATDPAASEEEARTAALAACRDIRRQGLEVRDPRAAGVGYTPPTPPARQLGGRAAPQTDPRRVLDDGKRREATFHPNTTEYEIGREDEGARRRESAFANFPDLGEAWK